MNVMGVLHEPERVVRGFQAGADGEYRINISAFIVLLIISC